MAKETSFSLRSLLEKQTLKEDGSNFTDWFRTLTIVLRREKKEYVLNSPVPAEPGTNGKPEDITKYNKHKEDELDVQGLVVSIMGPELQRRFMDTKTYIICDQLKNMFQEQARIERFKVTKSLLGHRLAEGGSMGTHMLRMTSDVEQLEKLNAPISKEFATDIILHSLPPSFSGFIMNFHMLGMDKSLQELQGMLRIADGDMKKKSSVLMIQAGGKKIKKAPKKVAPKYQGKGKKILKPNPPKIKVAASSECYYCNSKGHWKRNCLKYLADLKSGKFKEFKTEVENQLNKSIKTLRSDRGGEYLSFEFKEYLKECGIVSQLTPPGTPQWNGVSERRNRTLLDMVRSMMSEATLPKSFWGHALETAARTINMVPSKSVEKTPYELWFGKIPTMSYLKIWGCEVFVKRPTSGKLDPKADKCFFVGYPKETKGYYFYYQSENKIVVARHGIFLENEFLAKGSSGSKVAVDEVLVPSSSTSTQVEVELDPQTVVDQVQQPEERVLRRSTRVVHAPERYLGLHEISAYDTEDPLTYAEALDRPDSDKWLEAMRSEIQSMYDNTVWNLVVPPDGIKPIANKWVFKIKTDMDGKMTVYKARLVAKAQFHLNHIYHNALAASAYRALIPPELAFSIAGEEEEGREEKLSGGARMPALPL
ncbi:uncharacterized protein LOC144546757 [Carex rostrata]